ncbi:hypothetical protein QG37_07636 [Candidozyma auris]|nr:hypothetical protein QG37_07636 [[Candida] auris]
MIERIDDLPEPERPIKRSFFLEDSDMGFCGLYMLYNLSRVVLDVLALVDKSLQTCAGPTHQHHQHIEDLSAQMRI